MVWFDDDKHDVDVAVGAAESEWLPVTFPWRLEGLSDFMNGLSDCQENAEPQ